METGEGNKGPQTYKIVIKKEELSVFEQAAEKTGYGVNVTARAGEEILVKDRDRETSHKVEVSPGYVQVGVTIPPDQEESGTTLFYNVVRELKRSPK